MPTSLNCPAIDNWQALLNVSLPPHEQERSERHLESCPVCQERLEQAVERGDPLLRLAQQLGDPTGAPLEPALSALLTRLHGGPDKETRRQGDKETELGERNVNHPATRKQWSFFLLVSLSPCLLVCMVVAIHFAFQGNPVPPTPEASKELHFDFRGRPVPPDFAVTGDDGGYLRETPEGVRITLPKKRSTNLPVLLTTEFGLRGDFEVTATYDILQAELDTGWGVGATLRVDKAGSPESATLARIAKVPAGQVVFWDRAVIGPDQKLKFLGGQTASADTSIRLRLKRVGTTLYYLWATEADGEVFQELHHNEFGDADIKAVSMAAATGRQPRTLDLRIVEIRLRADSFPGRAESQPATPQAATSRWWLLVVEIVGAVVVVAALLGLGAWLYWRHSRRAIASPDKQVLAEVASVVAFSCAGCGKKLRARTELVGKKVKCSGCGQAVPVPSIVASS